MIKMPKVLSLANLIFTRPIGDSAIKSPSISSIEPLRPVGPFGKILRVRYKLVYSVG